jgi:ParB/RepB/Spo0J family partition protein
MGPPRRIELMATEIAKVKEEAKYIPLAQITADYEWNCRQGKWQDEPRPEEGKDAPAGSYWSLYNSLQAVGQDDPVVVRPTGKDKKPYELVAGFRRFHAIGKIAEAGVNIPKAPGSPKDPHILVIIRNLTDAESKALNLRENLERKGIRTADTAKHVFELSEKHGMPATEIATKIGMGNSNTSQMLRIMKGLSAPLAKRWQDDPTLDIISLDALEKIAQKGKGEQETEVNKVISAKNEKPTNQWVETAKREAAAIGTFLGNLEFLGLIDTSNLDFSKDFESLTVGGLLKIKGNKGSEGKATAKQKEDIVEAMTAAYNVAIEGPKEETVKDDGKGAKDGGNGKGGAKGKEKDATASA